MSYSLEIRKRVESLAAIAYFSGTKIFSMQVLHVFILFIVVNLFDVIVFDFGVFCYSKKLRIAGTADMDKEYESMDVTSGNYRSCRIYSSCSYI